MLLKGVITPSSDSTHRRMFERAYRGPFRDADETMMRRASMGAQIELVRRKLGGIAYSEGADAAAAAYENRFRGPLNDYVREQTEALKGPMLPYASLRQDPQLYAKTTDQLTLLPVMFMVPGNSARAHRERLIGAQGLYGTIANVLAQALQDSPEDKVEEGEWLGHITELTANAMVNRPQLEDAAALIALPAADEGAKIDLHYHFKFAGDRSGLHNRQVKLTMPAPQNIDPRAPRIITASMLGNDDRSSYWRFRGPLQTARAIVAENAGFADQAQAATLDRITDDLLISLGQPAIYYQQEHDLAA